MANLTTNAQYQQILSMSLESRSSSYIDLVSNNNALLAVLKRKGLWQTYSGPRIRQTLQVSKQVAQWYSGYDQLLNPAIDLFNDAYFEPKMVVVPVILSMQEILNNEGENQLEDVLDSLLRGGRASSGRCHGRRPLRRRQCQRRQADHRTGDGGADHHQFRQLRRLRSRHGDDLANQDLRRADHGPGARHPGQRYHHPPDAQLHHDQAVARPRLRRSAVDVARALRGLRRRDGGDPAQTNETSLGKLGFSALEYIGGGKRAEIVLDGGIGSNMPANTTFGLNTDSLRVRYHPGRNFDKVFEGDGMMPIDKDAIAQFIGWMGEITMTNPMLNWRLLRL